MKLCRTMMQILAISVTFTATLLPAEEHRQWKSLTEQSGCLVSAADVGFSLEGSIFSRADWQQFFESARRDRKIFHFVVSRFSSERPTRIHICNFKNAAEGEVAVFAAQQIIGENWYSYNGNDEKLRRIAKKNVAARSQLLKDVLPDEKLCSVLQKYFMERYESKFRSAACDEAELKFGKAVR